MEMMEVIYTILKMILITAIFLFSIYWISVFLF